MKEKISILLIVVLLIATAGCASKSDEASQSSVDQDLVDKGENLLPDDFIKEKSNEQEANIIEGTAEELFPDAEINPILEGVKTEINSNDLVLEKLEIIDRREYEEDRNWGILTTFRYDGDEPAFVDIRLHYWNYEDQAGLDKNRNYITVKKGDKFSLEIYDENENNFNHILTENEYKYMGLKALVHKKMITPKISSEFVNLNKTILVESSLMFIDTISVDLIQNEQNADWKTVVIDLQKDSPLVGLDTSGYIHLIDADGERLEHADGSEVYGRFIFGAKNTTTVEIDLGGDISQEEIYGIELHKYG